MSIPGFGRCMPVHIDMLQLAGYDLDDPDRQLLQDTGARRAGQVEAHRMLVLLTGQDYQFDLVAWRQYLLNYQDHGYTHPYAFKAVDEAILNVIESENAQRGVTLSAQQISYVIGDATAPTTAGNKMICHICNDVGAWGKGFVLAISKRWPQPEAAYRQWHHHRMNEDFSLGAIQVVPVEHDTWVINMIGQHGITRKGSKPIRYDAVEATLTKVAEEAATHSASIHMPRIGCGLAGGTWDKIEPIIQQTLCNRGINVVVYDL